MPSYSFPLRGGKGKKTWVVQLFKNANSVVTCNSHQKSVRSCSTFFFPPFSASPFCCFSLNFAVSLCCPGAPGSAAGRVFPVSISSSTQRDRHSPLWPLLDLVEKCNTLHCAMGVVVKEGQRERDLYGNRGASVGGERQVM